MIETFKFKTCDSGRALEGPRWSYPVARTLEEARLTQPDRVEIDARNKKVDTLERLFSKGYRNEKSKHPGALEELHSLVKTLQERDLYARDLNPELGKVVTIWEEPLGTSEVAMDFDPRSSGLEAVIKMEAYLADGREYHIQQSELGPEITMKLPDYNDDVYKLVWMPGQASLTVIPREDQK